MSEKQVIDQSYWVVDRYGITLLYT